MAVTHAPPAFWPRRESCAVLNFYHYFLMRKDYNKFWHALDSGEAGWRAGLVTKLAQA